MTELRTLNTTIERAGNVTLITFSGGMVNPREGLYMGEELFKIGDQQTTICFCSTDADSVERMALLFGFTPAEVASALLLDEGDTRRLHLASVKRVQALKGLERSYNVRKMLAGLPDFRSTEVV